MSSIRSRPPVTPDRQGLIAKADNIIAWCERYRATAQD